MVQIVIVLDNLIQSRRTSRSATGRNSGGVVAGGSRRAALSKTRTVAGGRPSWRWRPPQWPTRNTCTSSICRGGRTRPRWTRSRPSRTWTRPEVGATAGDRPSRCSVRWWTGRPGSQTWRWPRAPTRRTGRRSRCGPRSTAGVRWPATGERRNHRGWRTLKHNVLSFRILHF